MSRSGRRAWFVAMAGVAALTLIWACGAPVRTSQKTPLFARIVLSEKSVVYLQVQTLELRAAMSVEGLRAAAPVKLRLGGPDDLFLSEIALPIPADQLPAGITAIKANLGRRQVPAFRLEGQITVCRTDDRKSEWQYVSQTDVWVDANAEKSGLIKLPNFDKLKAVLGTKLSDGKLGVGLRITDGDATFYPLTDVRKEGQPAQVKMIVADASGTQIASKVGTLADFGFS
jgi:hypothetical protein